MPNKMYFVEILVFKSTSKKMQMLQLSFDFIISLFPQMSLMQTKMQVLYFSFVTWMVASKTLRSIQLDAFCKKRVLKNFTKFTGKCLCKSLFLIKLQASACEFCEILNTFFYRTPAVVDSNSQIFAKRFLSDSNLQ